VEEGAQVLSLDRVSPTTCVLHYEHTVAAIEAPMTDEMEHMELLAAEPLSKSIECGFFLHDQLHPSAYLEIPGGLLEQSNLLGNIELVNIGRAGNHQQDPKGWSYLKGTDRYGQFDETHEGCCGRQSHETSKTRRPDEFPGDAAEVRVVGHSQPDPQALAFKGGGIDAAPKSHSHFAGENSVVELLPKGFCGDALG
jgi:hypothetical protein